MEEPREDPPYDVTASIRRWMDPAFDGGAGPTIARWVQRMDDMASVASTTLVTAGGTRRHGTAIVNGRGSDLLIDHQVSVVDVWDGMREDRERRHMIRLAGQTWVAICAPETPQDEITWTHVVDYDPDPDDLPAEPDPSDEQAWAAWDAVVTAAYARGPGIYGLVAIQLPRLADPWRLLHALRVFPPFDASPMLDASIVWTSRIDGGLPIAVHELPSVGRTTWQEARVTTDDRGLPTEILMRVIGGPADDTSEVHITFADWGSAPAIAPPPLDQTVEHD